MNADRISSIITEHGEVIGVAQERQRGRTYGKSFMIIFLDAMEEAAQRINSACTLKLLMRLPRHLDFMNFRPIRQVQLAEEIGVTHGAISRSLRELLALGYVERQGAGPRQAWRMTTDWGWNGNAEQYHAFRGGRLKGKKAPANLAGSQELPHKEYSPPLAQDVVEPGKVQPQRTLRLLTPISNTSNPHNHDPITGEVR